MPSPNKTHDELKAERSEMKTLPESPTDENDQTGRLEDCGTNVPPRRRWFWADSCQPVIEKCDVWTAILKIPQ
jgi:hypothetical protein